MLIMKRWVVSIVMCVVLGVVTTVGVAWGLAVGVDAWVIDDHVILIGGLEQHERDDGEWDWLRLRGLEVPGLRVVERTHNIYPDRDRLPLRQGESPSDEFRRFPDAFHSEYQFASVHIVGWPMKSMSYWFGEKTHNRDERIVFNGLEVGFERRPLFLPDLTYDRVLPLRPIFPGFIINTLFYAAIWFVLIFGWRAHLRQVRKWQGYCPVCKYDLQNTLTAGCPECGWGRVL